MNELGCSFGDLGALLHLMQVNRAHAQVVVGKLLVYGALREVPCAMNMVRAQMEHHAPAIVGPSFDTIGSQLGAGLVSCDQPKAAKHNRSRHEL